MEKGTILFEVTNSRDSEEKPLAMEQVFAALGGISYVGFIDRLMGKRPEHGFFSFEIIAVMTYFF